MDIERKTFELKIEDLTEEGKFSGYLSIFGNIDMGGDIVEKGAFRKTLKDNEAFPLIWSHYPSEPDLVVGAFSGKEDEKGLLINGEFFLDIEGAQKAHKVTKRLAEKKIKMGLSMGYKTIKKLDDMVDNIPVRRLKEVRLHEGSLTLFPMNEGARIEAVKSEENEITIVCTSCGETLKLNEPKNFTRKGEPLDEDESKEFHSALKKIADNLNL